MADDIMHEEDLGLFFGSKSSYNTFKKKNNITTEEPEEKKEESEEESKPSNVAVFSKETLKELDEETLRILKRTRAAHDYSIVYMQSSLDFYDRYYNDDNISDEMKAARGIRRVYKIYTDYLEAIQIRNDYIEWLIEKHGGEDEFDRKMSMGMIKDWIPNVPILSKRCPDYEMYLSGMIPTTSRTLSEDEIMDVWKSMQEDVEDIDLEESFGVETNMGFVNQYNAIVEASYNKWTGSRKSSSVTINDLNELNKVFKSWYKPETGKVEREFFRNAPENIKKRFFDQASFDEPGLLTRINNGEDIDAEELDLNEMVHDSVTGKSMKRVELMQRQTIRLLAQNGWSESRLLNYSNVGSRLEKMNRRTKTRKKRKKKVSTEFYDEAMGPNGLDTIYSENDYMSEAFMNMMRGDD